VFHRPVFDLFISPKRHDYRLTPAAARLAVVDLSAEDLALPCVPGMPDRDVLAPLGWQYRHPAGSEPRPREQKPTLGAYAAPSR
jgi:hypothetical protein